VNTGDTLLIMEAMKMENNIQCETGGKIKSIMITEGENVLQGDILLEIE
jgi:biotin carboxyl carrier protein